MNKEVENYLNIIASENYYETNTTAKYCVNKLKKAFSDMEEKYDKLKIKVKNYMQLNSPALLFKDKWDEKIELEKEIKQLL